MRLQKPSRENMKKERKAKPQGSGFQPRYSQNFLRSPRLIKKLIEKSTIKPADLVYEIGPGRGVIAKELAGRCRRYIGIEKDGKLYQHLRRQFADNPKVEIRHGDFLEDNLPSVPYKVFANIPFNLTADIITKLTSANPAPIDIYLIVQQEAASRFAGLAKETQASLLLKPRFQLEIIHYFRSVDFKPVPKVAVVLLRLKRRLPPLVLGKYYQLYRDFVVYGFNQWKGTLRESLKGIFTNKQFDRLAGDLNFSVSAKPTSLRFEQWLGLFNYFLHGIDRSKQVLVWGAERRLREQQRRLKKIHRTRRSRYR